MSLETWKEEFYPIDACKVPKEQAAEHSLRKWIGLRLQNLSKHECYLDLSRHPPTVLEEGANRDYADTPCLRIDSKSCALCFRYDNSPRECEECPLYIVREKYNCCLSRQDENDAPFHELCEVGDAEPMIKWLQKAADLNSGDSK